jgi:hypothetical protein
VDGIYYYYYCDCLEQRSRNSFLVMNCSRGLFQKTKKKKLVYLPCDRAFVDFHQLCEASSADFKVAVILDGDNVFGAI